MAGYKIAEARRAKGWSQQKFADELGTTQQQIARWENGQRDPRADVVVKMSSILGVTVSYLLGVDGDPGYIKANRTPETHLLPVVGRIAAGTPREAIGQSDEMYETTDEIYKVHPQSFWLVVASNSMNRIFPESSLVLIDPNIEVHDGDVAALFVNGDDATLKRIFFEDGSIRLVPESYDPEYPERVIDQSDPDAPEVRILGKAVSYTAPDRWRA